MCIRDRLTTGELVLNSDQQESLFSSQNRPANNVTINISGNVDQRSIDQIRMVVSGSPEQVGSAMMQFDQATSGLRRGN